MQKLTAVRAKIKTESYVEIKNFCKAAGTTPSAYIRGLIERDKPGTAPINRAGVNELRFNQADDSFSWIIRYDDNTSNEIAESLSVEFLKNLQKSISRAISLRDEYIQKKLEDSVVIPANIKKLKGSGENIKS